MKFQTNELQEDRRSGGNRHNMHEIEQRNESNECRVHRWDSEGGVCHAENGARKPIFSLSATSPSNGGASVQPFSVT